MLWGGSPAKIIEAAEEHKVVYLITSGEIVDEISRTLMRPKLKRGCDLKGVSQQQVTEAVLRLSMLVEVNSRIHAVQENPEDDKFIECAVDGKADYVMSGDNHLLKIGGYKGIRIASVRPQSLKFSKNKGLQFSRNKTLSNV